jgi:neutral amino acid transport system permease protein
MPSTGLPNAVVTGIVTGSMVALGAIGLAMLYDIADVPNFAHGDLLTVGAYVALLVNLPGTVPLFDVFSPERQAIDVVGAAILFLGGALGTLGAVYHLGGIEGIKGSWWPVDPPPPVAVAVHLGVAVIVGTISALGVPSLVAAMVFAAAVLAGGAPLLEKYLFGKFRQRGASLAMMLVVSMGLAFVLRFSIQTVYGGTVRSYTVDPIIELFGTEFNVVTARFFDLYLDDGGAVIQVLDPLTDQSLAMASYSWPILAVTIFVAAVAAFGAYRWRLGKRAILGPYLLAALVAAVVLVAAGAVLSGARSVPDASFYSTRVRMSLLRLFVVVVALVMMGVLHSLLRATKLGKAMRATSDNRDLAMIRGIDTDKVMMAIWIFAGLFAGISGVTLGYLLGALTINLGFFLLLPMFAAVILGGISIYGAILGSYVVGLSMEVGVHLIPDVGSIYRVPLAFAVLMFVLLVKPEGITGG